MSHQIAETTQSSIVRALVVSLIVGVLGYFAIYVSAVQQRLSSMNEEIVRLAGASGKFGAVQQTLASMNEEIIRMAGATEKVDAVQQKLAMMNEEIARLAGASQKVVELSAVAPFTQLSDNLSPKAEINTAPDDLQAFEEERIIGMVGIEMAVYFENFSYFNYPRDYVVMAACTCGFGLYGGGSWKGTPSASDVGSHFLSWTVFDKSMNIVGQRGIELIVRNKPEATQPNLAQQDALKGRNGQPLNVMFIGDSITRQQYYINDVVSFLRRNVSDELVVTGRVALNEADANGYYSEAASEGVYSEAFNSWTTGSFVNRPFHVNPELNSQSPLEVVSKPPFWFGSSLEEGELNFAQYINENFAGVAPDIVFIMLGTNDFVGWGFDEKRASQGADNAVANLNTLIGVMSDAFPDIQYFVLNPPPTALSEKVFRKVYTSPNQQEFSAASFTWGHRLYSRTLKAGFDGRENEKIYYIPTNIGFDPVYGYNYEQVVHPSAYGHQQIANQIIAAINAWYQDGAGGLRK